MIIEKYGCKMGTTPEEFGSMCGAQIKVEFDGQNDMTPEY